MDRIRGQQRDSTKLDREGRDVLDTCRGGRGRSIEDEDGAAKEEEKMKASGGVHGCSEGRSKDRLRQSHMIHCGEP